MLKVCEQIWWNWRSCGWALVLLLKSRRLYYVYPTLRSHSLPQRNHCMWFFYRSLYPSKQCVSGLLDRGTMTGPSLPKSSMAEWVVLFLVQSSNYYIMPLQPEAGTSQLLPPELWDSVLLGTRYMSVLPSFKKQVKTFLLYQAFGC